MPVPSVGKTTWFFTKTRICNYFVYEQNFESTWLWGNSYRTFSFPKQWNWWMFVYQSNPEGVELFSYAILLLGYVAQFAQRNLGQRSETTHFLSLIYSAECSVGFGRIKTRRGYRRELSVYTKKVVHISWRHVWKVLKCYINTDLEF